jgi:hypothetical protein
MIGTRRRSFLPNFQKKNCVNLLLTALQSLASISRQNLLPQNPLKYPYFAIKHQFFITYINTNGRSHYARSATCPVLEITPFKSMRFQVGRPDRSENNPATGNRPI